MEESRAQKKIEWHASLKQTYKNYKQSIDMHNIMIQQAESSIEKYKKEIQESIKSMARLQKYCPEMNLNCVPDLFDKFVAERIRIPITFEARSKCWANPVETSRIRNVYTQWRKENQVSGLSSDQIITRLEAKYEKPEDKKWSSFKIFGSDEDVAEWDKDIEQKLKAPYNPL